MELYHRPTVRTLIIRSLLNGHHLVGNRSNGVEQSCEWNIGRHLMADVPWMLQILAGTQDLPDECFETGLNRRVGRTCPHEVCSGSRQLDRIGPVEDGFLIRLNGSEVISKMLLPNLGQAGKGIRRPGGFDK